MRVQFGGECPACSAFRLARISPVFFTITLRLLKEPRGTRPARMADSCAFGEWRREDIRDRCLAEKDSDNEVICL